jgi:hypothetical protein
VILPIKWLVLGKIKKLVGATPNNIILNKYAPSLKRRDVTSYKAAQG